MGLVKRYIRRLYEDKIIKTTKVIESFFSCFKAIHYRFFMIAGE